jgi:signal transduction histidine kinase
MLLSILRYFKIFSFIGLLQITKRRHILFFVKGHIALMIFFLIGYFIISYTFYMKLRAVNEIFVGLIFLFGAIFVFSGIYIQNSMIGEISNYISNKEKMEEDLRKNYDIQNVLNYLLNLQLKKMPLEDILNRSLEQILNISWLALESCGSIFCVEDDPHKLIMKAQKNLSEPICKACSEVEFGRCLCGRAAMSGETVFSDCLDDRHDVRYEGMADHGHFCVPIISSDNKVLGVINSYLKVGHKREEREELFLTSVANLLSSIIEQKKSEEETDKLQKKLLQSEKMAALGQLAGGIAHEINNPIGVILGFTQGLVKRIKEDDLFYTPLRSIEREAVRCKKIVGDLLIFSRKAKTDVELIDINASLDETLSLIEAQGRVKNIEIARDYGKDLPQIKLNKNQMQQVIVNLCNNAIDAMPDGGKITIKTRVFTDNDTMEISVSDTGQGMDKQILQRIFEPFFTTKEVGKGTGLGLSLCYEIIQKHKGTIEVESEIGRGTTFIIKLPLKNKE